MPSFIQIYSHSFTITAAMVGDMLCKSDKPTITIISLSALILPQSITFYAF